MAPIYSKQNVYFRSDRSVTQMMLENVSNTAPDKVISEDLLTKKNLTYGGLREDSFKAANCLRERYGIQPGDAVTIISRSCVSIQESRFHNICFCMLMKTTGRLHPSSPFHLGRWRYCQVWY